MRGAAIAGLCLAAVAAGAGLGHVRMPADLATNDNLRSPETPCVTEDGPGPCYWDAGNRGNGIGRSFWVLGDGTVAHVVDRETAYAMYLLAYGENNGCRADFDANYRGTRFGSDLPDDLQQELAEGRMSLDSDGFTESPMMADFEDGSVIEVLGDERITQVIVIGAYDGRC